MKGFQDTKVILRRLYVMQIYPWLWIYSGHGSCAIFDLLYEQLSRTTPTWKAIGAFLGPPKRRSASETLIVAYSGSCRRVLELVQARREATAEDHIGVEYIFGQAYVLCAFFFWGLLLLPNMKLDPVNALCFASHRDG
jgi:hypothetical protein